MELPIPVKVEILISERWKLERTKFAEQAKLRSLSKVRPDSPRVMEIISAISDLMIMIQEYDLMISELTNPVLESEENGNTS